MQFPMVFTLVKETIDGVSLRCFKEDQWLGFCRAMGNPPWTQEPKFATLIARKETEDELDERMYYGKGMGRLKVQGTGIIV